MTVDIFNNDWELVNLCIQSKKFNASILKENWDLQGGLQIFFLNYSVFKIQPLWMDRVAALVYFVQAFSLL